MTQHSLTREERKKLWQRLSLRLVLIIGFVLCCLFAIPPLFSLLAPFVLALVAAMALNPTIRFLQRQLGWGRGIFTLLVLVLLLGLFGGGLFALGYMAIGELALLGENWEAILLHATQAVNQLDAMADALWALMPPMFSTGVDAASHYLLQWLQEVAPLWMEWGAVRAGLLVGAIPSFFLAFLIFLLATYFLTADYPYLRTRIISKMDEGLLNFLRDLRQTALAAFGGYLRAQLLLSVGVFFILMAGFFWIGQPYGLILALGLAVLDFIPILGSGTVMVPWAFLLLFTGYSPQAVEIMIIWGLIALFRRVAEPKFVGNQTGLSPVLSLVSIYVGMGVAGIWGMIFGPILALILLNLSALGIFRGFFQDLLSATRDMAEFLGRP